MIYSSAIVALGAMIMMSSCSKDSTTTVNSVQKTDSLKVNFSSTAPFAFFSFKDGTMVANTDSASTKWDFGLRLTTFILNSHTYGPGDAGAILQTALYDDVTAAPDNGYAYDTTASQKAIKDGSWYNYNPTTHAFAPKAGQTFIFRTADDHYVKMELLAVDYEPFVGPAPVRLIYRFRYNYSTTGKAF